MNTKDTENSQNIYYENPEIKSSEDSNIALRAFLKPEVTGIPNLPEQPSDLFIPLPIAVHARCLDSTNATDSTATKCLYNAAETTKPEDCKAYVGKGTSFQMVVKSETSDQIYGVVVHFPQDIEKNGNLSTVLKQSLEIGFKTIPNKLSAVDGTYNRIECSPDPTYPTINNSGVMTGDTFRLRFGFVRVNSMKSYERALHDKINNSDKVYIKNGTVVLGFRTSELGQAGLETSASSNLLFANFPTFAFDIINKLDLFYRSGAGLEMLKRRLGMVSCTAVNPGGGGGDCSGSDGWLELPLSITTFCKQGGGIINLIPEKIVSEHILWVVGSGREICAISIASRTDKGFKLRFSGCSRNFIVGTAQTLGSDNAPGFPTSDNGYFKCDTTIPMTTGELGTASTGSTFTTYEIEFIDCKLLASKFQHTSAALEEAGLTVIDYKGEEDQWSRPAKRVLIKIEKLESPTYSIKVISGTGKESAFRRMFPDFMACLGQMMGTQKRCGVHGHLPNSV